MKEQEDLPSTYFYRNYFRSQISEYLKKNHANVTSRISPGI